jgi:hypothetical protein
MAASTVTGRVAAAAAAAALETAVAAAAAPVEFFTIPPLPPTCWQSPLF